MKPEEIRQIAGRAGRYGMYAKGYVGATQNLELIRAGLEAVVPPLQYAVVGFSDLVLQVDFDLLEVLTQWNQMPTVEPYRKLDITRYIAIISKMREMGFLLSKEQELRAANIPFDETEEALRELFFQFLNRWQRGEPIEQPGQPEEVTLPGAGAVLPEAGPLLFLCQGLRLPCGRGQALRQPGAGGRRDQRDPAPPAAKQHPLLRPLRKALPLHHRGRSVRRVFPP